MRVDYFISSWRWIVPWVLLVAFPRFSSAQPRRQSNQRACLQAARRWLGASAEVAKCGHLTGPESIEVMAILPLSRHKKYPGRYYVSKFVILRRTGPDTWTLELRADQLPPRNRSGYMGVDFLDNCPSYGYALDPADHIMVDDPTSIFNNRPDFTLWLHYLNPEREVEGASTEISWNPEARRFQEFDYEVGRFKPELRNPPYRKLCGDSTYGSPVAPRKHR